MKYVCLKKGLAVASLLAVSLLARPATGQAPRGGVAKDDEAAARAVASAFAARLGETHDFAPVVRELYAEDFMARQLRNHAALAGEVPSTTFMLGGIPSLTFGSTLAAKAEAADWTRLRVAADNLLHFVYVSVLSRMSFEELADPGKYDDRALLAVFPPEAVRVLDSNPAAANLLKRKGGEVVVRTPEELRALTATLEEAARLTRPRFAEMLAKGRHLESNLRLFEKGFARDEVMPADLAAGPAGYPAGTHLFMAFAPNGYRLLLVKSGAGMKILWAGLAMDGLASR